jgi:hypothetical protein
MNKIVVTCAYLIIFLIGSTQALAARPCHESNGDAHKQTNKIAKSDNDHSLYRYLKLDNEMQVLLVSDEKADKAAAALDVFVGSSHDPVKRQGLALIPPLNIRTISLILIRKNLNQHLIASLVFL